MLAKENRLVKKKDFDRVFKQGQGFKQDFLFLKIAKNNLKKTRFGFIVSKKISPKAVIRNHVKRLLREIVYSRLKKIKPGIDVVIVALPGIENQNFQEIEKTIEKLFKKAKIL